MQPSTILLRAVPLALGLDVVTQAGYIAIAGARLRNEIAHAASDGKGRVTVGIKPLAATIGVTMTGMLMGFCLFDSDPNRWPSPRASASDDRVITLESKVAFLEAEVSSLQQQQDELQDRGKEL